VSRDEARTIVAVAAAVGRTRLIDNVMLGEGVAADPVARG
jgi:pantothenate synthetase